MDANDLIRAGEFIYGNFLVMGNSEFLGFNLNENGIDINENPNIDESRKTDIFENFSIEIGGSIYSGGEASAHGSCGFFYKKTGNNLDWFLMALESNPFIGVEKKENGVRFLSSSGFEWIIKNDNIVSVKIATYQL